MAYPIASPLQERLFSLIASAERRLYLVAPFISRPPLEQIAEILQRRQQPPAVQILTRFHASSLSSGSLDAAALAQFADSLPATLVLSQPHLHAKIYLADEHAAIITSANLTQGGLKRNWEYSVWLEEPTTLRQVRADIDAATANATAFPREFLHDIAAAQTDAPPARQTAHNEEIADLLSQINPQTRQIEPPDEKVSPIFAESIVIFLAEKGPLRTTEIYPLIKAKHPEYCDDNQIAWTHGGHECKKWERDTRNAQQKLKKQERIIRDPVTRRWRLT